MLQVYKLLAMAALTATLLVSFTAAAAEQNTNKNYEAPRNALGQPDLEGVWDFRTLTPLERPLALGEKEIFSAKEEEVFLNKAIAANDVDKHRSAPAAYDVEGGYNSAWYDFGTTMNEDRRTSLITLPANGRLPELTAESRATLKSNPLRVPPVRDLVSIGLTKFRPAGPETLGLSERCLLGFNAGPPLSPSAYNNNLRIVQTPQHVVLFTEMIHDARIVQLDGRAHLPSELQRWTGESRGHWEGNTLVVETRNFTNKTPTFQLPFTLDNPEMIGTVGSGANMTLIERFTRVSDSRMVYEYTLDDPKAFAQPFTVAIPMRASDEQIFEYACHEGNYSMAGMLKGARTLEKEAAMAAAGK